MLRYLSVILLLVLPIAGEAQFSRSYIPSVRTPRVELNGEWDAPPVMKLGSDDELLFAFDEMSHTYKRYICRLSHRNADWSESSLLEIEYLEGFNDMPIEQWENSVNTTQLFTTYEYAIPNDDVSLKVSGNYRLEVFEDGSSNALPVASFDFSVVEPVVSFSSSVSGNTDRSFNDGEQQLSFLVDYSNYRISSPASEVIPVVYQNRRRDNAVYGVKPTYITGNRLEYVHNDKLIFDAGNEYRRFEITDPNSPGENIEEVIYSAPDYHALLYIDKQRRYHSNYREENGRFFINTLEGYGTELETDYIYVHFALEVPYRSGGNYYLLGDAFGDAFSELNRLDYDAESGYYHATHLLKLGVYNYMYVWLPDNMQEFSFEPSEGNIYNTENEYLIYIYHRAFGDRYDKLIGVHSIDYTFE